jgi:hypothetical protein
VILTTINTMFFLDKTAQRFERASFGMKILAVILYACFWAGLVLIAL